MKRNLYIAGHRRPAPEAGLQQGGTAPSRPAPRRYRAGPQRREPYAATDERRPEGAPFSHSPDRSRHNARFLNENELRIEAERHQKSELKRLREEVLDIARELKDMRRLETARSGAKGFAGKPGRAEATREFGARTRPPGMSRSSKFAADIQQKARPPFTVYDAPGEPAQPCRAPASRPPAAHLSGNRRRRTAIAVHLSIRPSETPAPAPSMQTPKRRPHARKHRRR